MYERCISCSIDCGRMRAVGSCWASSGMYHLDVEVHDVLRVLLDILPTGADRLAHQDREECVRGGGILDCDLLQNSSLGVHRRLPQLLGVHLPETLVSLERDALVPERLCEFLSLSFRVRVVNVLALADFVERGLCYVHVPCVDHRTHISEE